MKVDVGFRVVLAPGWRATHLVVVVVVVAATPNYLRQASQNLGKYIVTI